MRMATLFAPGAPVTRASPMVIITASTLPALKASIDGAYSNHSKSVSRPASLNQPFRIPTSNAVQPGQSLNAIFSGGFAGLAGASTLADSAGAEATDASFLSHPTALTSRPKTAEAITSVRLGSSFMGGEASRPIVIGRCPGDSIHVNEVSF